MVTLTICVIPYYTIRWVSEKFDGVRAYWNGKGRLFFANGKEIKCPEFFTTGLPYHPLDGELWYEYTMILLINLQVWKRTI
jgi:DNA ligase-1